MRCPACGHANSDLATRCASCGAELPSSPFEDVAKPAVDDLGLAQTTVVPRHLKTESMDAKSTVTDEQERLPEIDYTSIDEIRVDSNLSSVVSEDETDDEECGEDTDDEYVEDIDEEGADYVDEFNEEFEEDYEEDYDELNEGQHEDSDELRRPRKPHEHKVATFVVSHQKGLGIGLALVVITILGATWLIFSLRGAPAKAEIANDLTSHLPAYSYAGGNFGPDEEIALTSLTVTRLEPTSAPEGTDTTGIGPSAYLCDAEATYEGEHIRATRTVSGTYIRTDDGWRLASDLTQGSTSLTPTAGVDVNKMLASITDLLLLAQEGTGTDLSTIYAGGGFQVAGERFDEATKTTTATDSVTITCSQTSTFYSYEGVLNARFAFEEDTWHLEAAQMEPGATVRNYEPLIGIWEGPAIDHEASGKVCYGAQDVPLSLVIESIGETEGDQTSVSGTIYGIVHAHGELERQQMSDANDVHIEMVPFVGSLTSGYDSDLALEATVAYEAPQKRSMEASDEVEDEGNSARDATLQRNAPSMRASQDSSGTLDVTFVCYFDETEGVPSVICDLTSTYSYEEVVFLVVPREAQARFTDTYNLTRVE